MKKTAKNLLKGNTIIIGKPGIGKTHLIKEILLNNLVDNQILRILVADFEQEFKGFAKELNGSELYFEVSDKYPILNDGVTVLIPSKWEDILPDASNAQEHLEKILTYALDNDVDTLLLSENAFSYVFLDNIEKYKDYMNKIKIVLPVHGLDPNTDVKLKNFENVVIFASDKQTTDILGNMYGIDSLELFDQKRGEYQIV